MLNDSFAPIKRAILFFGLMGFVVSILTFGAGFQQPDDQSSMSVAQAKAQRQDTLDTRFAAVDPSARQVSPAKRAIATTQQALLQRSEASILR